MVSSMDDATRTAVDKRLRRVAGQVAGIQRMLEEDRYCVDVLLQIAAVRGALDQAGKLILGNHVETCVADAFASGSKADRRRKKDELLDDLLKALVHQVRVRVDYKGVVGEGRTHEFDPYSLVEHRGGLYLLGKSHLEGKIIWLAVERIRSVDEMRDTGGAAIKFAYPPLFDPLRHADGMFGVFDGKKVRVELALQN